MTRRNRPRKSASEMKEIGKKQCTQCKNWKDKSEFPSRSRLYLSSWCKKCHAEYTRQYRKREGQREQRRLYMQEYRKKRKESLRIS